MINLKIGKVFAIIGGILSLLGIFLFSLVDMDGFIYINGIDGILNIPGLFGEDGAFFADLAGVGHWVIILAEVGVILYLLSWLFQFLGAKFRFFSALGSIFPLFVGTMLLLGIFSVEADFIMEINLFLLVALGGSAPLIDGIIPLEIGLGSDGLTVGLIVLLLGAFISFISIFMKRED